jgi:hypothetical protein
MSTNRRSFIAGLLASAAAPAFPRPSIMQIDLVHPDLAIRYMGPSVWRDLVGDKLLSYRELVELGEWHGIRISSDERPGSGT